MRQWHFPPSVASPRWVMREDILWMWWAEVLFVHVFTSLVLDRLLQLPKVCMVLDRSVRVRKTSGSLKRENSNALTHGGTHQTGDRHAARGICYEHRVFGYS